MIAPENGEPIGYTDPSQESPHPSFSAEPVDEHELVQRCQPQIDSIPRRYAR